MASPGPTPGVVFPRQYGTVWGASLSAWVTYSATTPTSSPLLVVPFTVVVPGLKFWVPVGLSLSGSARPGVFTQSPTASLSTSGGTPITDGEPHLLVAVVEQDAAANTVISVYCDGVLAATQTTTTASLGGQYVGQANTLNVGGLFDGTNSGNIHNGILSEVAMWSRPLSAAEVTTLWTAGGLGYAGETTGTRTSRHLVLGRFAGASRVSSGSSTMQASSWTGSMDLLTDTQNTTGVEQGQLWAAPDGAIAVEGRQDRWLRLTASHILGEDTAAGEYPYSEEVEFDDDPTYVFSDVTATRPGGTVASGGLTADITATVRRFFRRRFGVTGDWATDQLAQDAANWIFYSHRAPLQRVSVITLDPAANPTLWPLVLGIEVGTRVTVKRRPKAANAGAGITMSADYFVENVTHHSIDFDAGTWRTKLLLSPIGTAPGVTFQPWVLEDPTLGVLNSTTVLGW